MKSKAAMDLMLALAITARCRARDTASRGSPISVDDESKRRRGSPSSPFSTLSLSSEAKNSFRPNRLGVVGLREGACS
jgi:hypothetical protein